VDYYPEGFLIWLEADTNYPAADQGTEVDERFLPHFHGGGNTPPKVITYTFDDVVKTLNEVTPYEWANSCATVWILMVQRSARRHHQRRLKAGL